jgi:hypothetical protein
MWKPKSGTPGTFIRYTSAMIYSIAVLELADFEGIGRKMPKGTGVDATANNGARASRHETKKCKVGKYDDSSSIVDIPEWDGCHPDFIMKRMKAILRHDLVSWGKREFYKSYSSWEKMMMDQRNKALSYFRSLPEEVQGMYAFSFIFLFYCSTPAR